MKLVNFLYKGEKNIGALLDDGVCSFKSISDKYSMSMLEFIEQNGRALSKSIKIY